MRTWTVQGTDQQTGLNVSILVEAETDAEAANDAKKRGLLVVSVHEAQVDRAAIDRPDPAPQLNQSEILRRIDQRLGELLEYARPIRFWVTFIGIVVLLILSLILVSWIIARVR